MSGLENGAKLDALELIRDEQEKCAKGAANAAAILRLNKDMEALVDTDKEIFHKIDKQKDDENGNYRKLAEKLTEINNSHNKEIKDIYKAGLMQVLALLAMLAVAIFNLTMNKAIKDQIVTIKTAETAPVTHTERVTP